MERLGGKMERFGRLLLGVVVWAAMMLGFACTAQAYESNPYKRFVLDMRGVQSTDGWSTLASKTVRFGGYDWYIIEDNSTVANAGSVTLFAADPLVASVFGGLSNRYSTSTVRGVVDGMTASGGILELVADAIKSVKVETRGYRSGEVVDTVDGAKCYLLDTATAAALPQATLYQRQVWNDNANYPGWWLRSPGAYGFLAANVHDTSGRVDDYGVPINRSQYYILGVRPALQLDLSRVVFYPDIATFALPGEVAVRLDASTDSLPTDGVATLTATIKPDNLENKSVIWSVDDGIELYSDQKCQHVIDLDTPIALTTVYAKAADRVEQGTYTVTVQSAIDISKTDEKKLDVGKHKTNMTVSVADAYVGEPTTTVEGDNHLDASGTVKMYLDDAAKDAPVVFHPDLSEGQLGRDSLETEDGKFGPAVLPIDGLKVGWHKLMAVYSGDDGYLPATIVTFFEIKKHETTLKASADKELYALGETATVIADVLDNATGTVRFYLDGAVTAREVGVANGKAVCTFDDLESGNHTVWAVLDDEYYTADPVTVTFKVDVGGEDPAPTKRRTSSKPSAGKAVRLWGEDRYGTMSAIVDQGFSAAGWAIVTSATNYPDTLCASGLAGAYGAPVVTTASDALSPEAAEQLVRLGVTNVLIMGGTSAISEAVEAELASMEIETSRVAGDDRLATSVEAFRRLRVADASSDTVVVATGYGFADALSASPWSWATKSPVVLAGADGLLTEDTVSAILDDGGIRRVVLLGGSSVVSDGIAGQLGGAMEIVRLGGDTRYATSRKVAEWAAANGLGFRHATVATGRDFPDALAGAALAGSKASVLVVADDPADTTVDLLRSHRSEIVRAYVLGGSAAVSNAVLNAIS